MTKCGETLIYEFIEHVEDGYEDDDESETEDQEVPEAIVRIIF